MFTNDGEGVRVHRKMELKEDIEKLKKHKDGDSTIAPILQERKTLEIKRIDEWWKHEEPEILQVYKAKQYLPTPRSVGADTNDVLEYAAGEERERRRGLGRHVKMNREARARASNSPTAQKVR